MIRLDEAIRAGIEDAQMKGNRLELLEPLFDLDQARFGRFLTMDPPTRRYILEGVLPLDVVGLLASMGGAGKSYLAFQLAISVVTGIPFIGLNIGTSGSVLCLFAEDDEGEIHRRARTLLDHMGLTAAQRDALAENLYVVSRVGEDNMLTRATSDGDVARTALVARVIETAKEIPDLRLIVIDPLSRSRGGNANNEEHATRFVEALEEIRKATGATVLGLHHVSQAGIKDGGGQEIVRGSTALVDGVRWVATLQRLRRDQAKSYGLQAEEADRYLRLDLPKSNYAPPFPGLWLRREAGGVIVPTELEETGGARELKAETEFIEIVARLQTLLKDTGPLSRRELRNHCGRAGTLKAGDQTVRAVLERAIREDYLLDIDGKVQACPEVAE